MIKIENPLNAWLGEIPTEWKKRRLKYIFSIKKEIAGEEGHTVLSVTQQGIVPKNMEAKGQFAADYSKYQLVEVGNFVMNHMDLLTGWVDISAYDGVTSPDYRVFVLNDTQNFYAEFYKYIFQLCYKHRIFYGLGQGVAGFGRWRLPADMFLNFELPVPSYQEQEKIARYLNDKITTADELIDSTKATIEEYKLLRSALIAEAVFGHSSDNKYVPSGYDWIKKIPYGWKMRPLKSLYTFGKGLNITKADLVESGVPVISYGQIHSKTNTGTFLDESLLRFVPSTVAEEGSYAKLKKGCFVFADTSEDVEGCGNCVYVDKELDVYAGYHTVTFFPKNDFEGKYLSYLFKTNEWRSQIRSKVTGVKLFSISKKILSSTSVLLPPPEEQERICNLLDEKCSVIDAMIQEKQELISELSNVKVSMIYEYVTGKRRVV